MEDTIRNVTMISAYLVAIADSALFPACGCSPLIDAIQVVAQMDAHKHKLAIFSRYLTELLLSFIATRVNTQVPQLNMEIWISAC